MQRVLYLLLCSIAILYFLDGVRFSEAEDSLNDKLNGTYVLNGMRTCINVADNEEASPSTNTAHFEGMIIYNGDGTGKLWGDLIIHNHTGITLSIWETECTMKYSVHDNLNFAQKLDCDATRIFPGPAEFPQVIIIREGIEHEGRITQGGDLLLVSDTNQNVEEVTVYRNGSPSPSDNFKSICGRTFTAVRTNQLPSSE
jgi:hypothetical protein